jgi:ASC-1-like (ASCH) protein
LPLYFIDIDNGQKTCEVRFNDRDFRVGDILHLQEWLVNYTGRQIDVEVTHVLKNCEWCKDGYAILSFRKLRERE